MSIVVLLVCLRAGTESSMMSAYGPDAQMGIWSMFMVVKVAFWVTTGVAAATLLGAVWPNWWKSIAACALGMVWIMAICWSSFRYCEARAALVDASAPTTSPERLRELVDFDGIQAGYELDNRIASNPSSPPDVLGLLHARPDQIGTEMSLARNPNTPDDILREFANRDGVWSQHLSDSLKRNPRYDYVFGERE